VTKLFGSDTRVVNHQHRKKHQFVGMAIVAARTAILSERRVADFESRRGPRHLTFSVRAVLLTRYQQERMVISVRICCLARDFAAVMKIRQVLKDDPEQPRFIQTITGRGYRFIGQISEVGTPAANGIVPAQEKPDSS